MLKTVFSIIIFFGGLTALITVTVWPEGEKSRKTVTFRVPDPTTYEQSYKLKLQTINPDKTKESNNKTQKLVQFVPHQFENAACIDLERLRKFHWASLFFSSLQIKEVKEKFNSLGISLNNIEALCIGFKSYYSFFSIIGGKVKINIRPHIFLVSGKRGRMEALRNYWQKRTSQEKDFGNGDFNLIFPSSTENDMIAGSYKTDLKSVTAILSSQSNKPALCNDDICKNLAKTLGVFPNIIFLTRNVDFKLLPNFKIKALTGGLEFNPDGFIIKAIIETTGNCEENIKRLRSLGETVFNRYNLDPNIPQRVNAICKNHRIIATISMSSAEFYNQIHILGLIKDLPIT
ncbi:hypothetical protein KKF34_06545 [Myxococcota bacterium]|nr:hypothetical protein [Myxococcota bacterium]MBU1381675.1 hypothetical protein [Myxococcota bacterium]MBU1496518.1 hypothetical protein [Myxococcota bacterium]